MRYNPAGDSEMNRRQAARVRHLSEYLHGNGREFMFELVAPAEQAEFDEVHGDRRAYDWARLRRQMVDAIRGPGSYGGRAALVAAAPRAGASSSCSELRNGESASPGGRMTQLVTATPIRLDRDGVEHAARTATGAILSLLVARLFSLPESYWAATASRDALLQTMEDQPATVIAICRTLSCRRRAQLRGGKMAACQSVAV